MKIIYNIFISLYPLIAKLLSYKNEKAKLWIEGRKNIFTHLEKSFVHNKQPVIWMHCSSLGEFEQGRPIIEKIKQRYSNYKILLTFFSPSGFEVQKKYVYADWVFYLPIDSKKNAQKFLDIVQPLLIFFVKYEFWFYYLTEIHKRNIPLLLISASFRHNQPFFKWYGSLYRRMLHCFTYIFVQDKSCATLLKNIGIIQNVAIAGDTRFDRVLEIAHQINSINEVENFINKNKVIVAGSTWLEDDETLDHYANTHPDIKFIIAPHQIEEERIQECLTLYKNSILFSNLSTPNNDISKYHVLIIDNVGMLSKLYKYASICYVGGAFGNDGVHNVLEAAVYGKPVVFGPVFEKYTEAVELIENNGGVSIQNALELEKVFDRLFTDHTFYTETAESASKYVTSKSGASLIIMNYIYEKRLLTN